MKENDKKDLWTAIVSVCIGLLFVGCMFALSSCNVTRTITTQSQYFTKGDTTCTIVTKTIETYDATKKQ